MEIHAGKLIYLHEEIRGHTGGICYMVFVTTE